MMMMMTMKGPHGLSYDALQRLLPKARSGIYALGYVDPEGRFRVQSVGRDDYDVRARLSELIGSSMMFKFAVMADARDAFLQECALFHEFRPPSTIIHPVRARGTDWQCPHCLQHSL
jgi:hypothetical protein